MNGWIVARIHHQREKWACENIMRQGAIPYLPMFAERKVTGRKRKIITLRPRYLFPGYGFIKTDGRWRFLMSTFGVMDIVLSGSSPAVLPDAEIERLKAREDADGFVVLPKPTKDGERFERGVEVRVSGGLYSGYKGIYQGCSSQERQEVLLDYLGRKTRFLIEDEHLESA